MKYLDGLAKRETRAWRRVEMLIGTRRPKEYDQAVKLLKDLLEASERAGRKPETEVRIRQVRERHHTKPSLLSRLDEAGLGAKRRT